MHVVIFEGNRWHSFAPLALGRPVFTLASGTGSLLDKQVRHLRPSRLTLWVRPEQEAYCRERVLPHLPAGIAASINTPLDDEEALLVNGRTVHFGKFEYPPEEAVVLDEGEFVRFAHVRRPGLSPDDLHEQTGKWLALRDLPHMMPQARLVESLWDLIHWDEEAIVEDAIQLPHPAPPKPAGPYHLVNPDEIWLGAGAKLGPGCVVD